MSFANSAEPEGWGNDQIEIIRGLLPHIRQFARVRRVLDDARVLGASLAELLDSRRLGLIQLDHRGRVLKANDRASDILVERDGLVDSGGVLAAANRQEDAELQRLLARALLPDNLQAAGGSLKITRTTTRVPLVLEIHAMRRMGVGNGGSPLGALVLVLDPATRRRLDPDLVTRFLGLTPMEGRVALQIAAGETVAGTANALGCAEGTARTHLRQVYRKLGIRKQTELVRRVLSIEIPE